MEKKLVIHFFVQTVHKQGTFFRYHNWAIGLTKLGHEVKVFGASYTRGDKDRIEVIDGIQYHISACYFPLQSIFGQTTHPYAGLKRMLKNYGKCDVAHVFQPHLSGYLPWYKNRKHAKLNVYDWDDLWTDGLAKKGKAAVQNFLYNQVKSLENKGPVEADRTTTCSLFLASRAESLGATNVKIIHNGFWQYTPNTKLVSRKNCKLHEDAFYLGFMGRTSHRGEMMACFELLKRASETVPNIRLALCGMPTDVVKDADPGILDRIDHLGYLTPLETKDFACALDVALLPLTDEKFNQSRFPIKFAEYIAANLPVICSNVGECAGIAKDIPSVKIVGTSVTDWVESGTEFITQVINKQIPLLDADKASSFLGWDHISETLLNFYSI